MFNVPNAFIPARLEKVLGVAVLGVAMLGLAQEKALACWWTNYHGTEKYTVNNISSGEILNGVASAIFKVNFNVTDAWCGGFVDQEMWAWYANSSPEWVETGYTSGWINGGYQSGYVFFWAEQDQSQTYSEYNVGGDSDPVGTYRFYLVEPSISGQQNVYIDSSGGWIYVGTATNIPQALQGQSVGIESTANNQSGTMGSTVCDIEANQFYGSQGPYLGWQYYNSGNSSVKEVSESSSQFSAWLTYSFADTENN